jgi:hypothetical protein
VPQYLARRYAFGDVERAPLRLDESTQRPLAPGFRPMVDCDLKRRRCDAGNHVRFELVPTDA